MEAISEINCENVIFLRSVAELLSSWETSKRPGLSSQTFLACRQTFLVLADLAEHLLRHDFQFVLLGKISSDQIEGRFGWYRQLCGGNFFISVNQLLQGEKRIRTLNEIRSRISSRDLQLDDLNSSFVGFVGQPEIAGAEQADVSYEDSNWLSSSLSTVEEIESISEDNLSVIYYVSGYCGRSVSRSNKCSECKSILLQTATESLDVSENELNNDRLFKMVDRGGLAVPSEICFMLSAFIYRYFEQIVCDDEFLRKFFVIQNQQKTFISAVYKRLAECDTSKHMVETQCSSSHKVYLFLCRSLFNCFMKNTLKRKFSSVTDDSDNKKIKKLRSQQ